MKKLLPFGQESLLLEDGIHLSEEGHLIYTEYLIPKVIEKLIGMTGKRFLFFVKVLFLSEGKLAQICLKVLMSDDFRNDFSVASMVSSETFQNGFRAEHEEGRDLHFISNEERNEDQIIEAVNSLGIETLISVQHKWILGEGVISAVSGKAFNLHNAKLPDYKGHNTVSFAILNDEKSMPLPFHWIAPKVDSGDLVLESSVEVDPSETARSLYKRLFPEAENLMKDFLRLCIRTRCLGYP